MIKELPLIGLGTFQMEDKREIKDSIEAALKAGYKHIDTAQIYNNETQIGESLQELGTNREEIFITSKIRAINFKYYTRKSTLESLKRLKIDQLDLLLLHSATTTDVNIIAFKELMKLRDEGLTRLIGVSNFSVEKLKELYEATGEHPYCNQIVLSPTQRVKDIEDYCNANGIKLTGYSVLKPYFGAGAKVDAGRSMSEEQKLTVQAMAKKHNKNIGQVLNKWALQLGYHILPKSSKVERVATNNKLFDLKLSDEEMNLINSWSELSSDVYAKSISNKNLKLVEEEYKKGLLFDRNF